MAIRDLIPWRKREREEERGLAPAEREIFDPFREAFEEAFRSLFLAPWRAGERPALRFSPSVDISESDEAYHISVELPGLSRDDVEVSLDEGVLTVRGEKKEEEREEEENYLRVERSYGSFVRRIPLPQQVDEDATSATFKEGLLQIELPKTEEARGRQIEITGE
jgi:HSP20 family protein